MTLRQLLSEPDILVAPGVSDALTALIAQQAGARALYLSGAALAYARFGRPDIGLVSMSEAADHIAAIRDRTHLPLIVDADTGFGNALNMQRTMRTFERAGANALQIEDQTLPKRCGHLDGKTLVAATEMTGKIRAAVDARASRETLIIARTDAIAVEGLEAALDRSEAFLGAGADVLFIEAPQTRAQLEAIARRFEGRVPVMANMVEGGKTPAQDARDLQALGFALVIFPGGIVRALARTAEAYYETLLATGSTEGFRDHMHDFAGLGRILGTGEMLEKGKSYGD
ncbi:MAG: isocitrate lyase/phosphoenolpyruvate mutase family protein [Pseudomonadota bacterium]